MDNKTKTLLAKLIFLEHMDEQNYAFIDNDALGIDVIDINKNSLAGNVPLSVINDFGKSLAQKIMGESS